MLKIFLCILILLSLVGIVWLIKNNKDQVRAKLSKYVYWILSIIFCSLFGVLIGALINSKGEELGSWADWASAIMSFIAIIVVFWQVNKESQNERAFYIENKRPHFSVERTTIINLYEKILYDENYGDLKDLYKELHGNEQKYIVRLTNSSDNTIYSLKISIEYTANKTQRINKYALDSLYSKQAVLLVTDERIPSSSSIDLWVKFETVANETGYFYFEVNIAGDSNKYTFVKDKEPVSAYGNDALVYKYSNEVKKLEENFEGKYSYKVVTIPKEEFEELQEVIHEKKKH